MDSKPSWDKSEDISSIQDSPLQRWEIKDHQALQKEKEKSSPESPLQRLDILLRNTPEEDSLSLSTIDTQSERGNSIHEDSFNCDNNLFSCESERGKSIHRDTFSCDKDLILYSIMPVWRQPAPSGAKPAPAGAPGGKKAPPAPPPKPGMYLCALRVPPGVYFDVLRQSHCPLIFKEPHCPLIFKEPVRPPKPYMA